MTDFERDYSEKLVTEKIHSIEKHPFIELSAENYLKKQIILDPQINEKVELKNKETFKKKNKIT